MWRSRPGELAIVGRLEQGSLAAQYVQVAGGLAPASCATDEAASRKRQAGRDPAAMPTVPSHAAGSRPGVHTWVAATMLPPLVLSSATFFSLSTAVSG